MFINKKKLRNGYGKLCDTNIYLSPIKKAVRRAYVCSFLCCIFLYGSFFLPRTLIGYKIIENQSIYLIFNSFLTLYSHHELIKRLNDFFSIFKLIK